MFLAGGVAVSAMTAYAFHSGLVDIVRNIQIEIVDSYDENREDETDEDQKYSNIYTEFAFKHNGPIRPQNICCVNQERYDISQIYHVARYFTITYISIK